MGTVKLLKHLIFSLTIGLWLFSFHSCSSKTNQDPSVEKEEEVSVPVQKKILYSQRTQGGKNAINVIEEQQANKRTLRIIVQRGDLNSNLLHPIESPNP